MSATSDTIAITISRRILEHPRALHIHRMRASIWLYLALLSRLPKGSDTVEVEIHEIAMTMGLPEGTIRSWLGHLRRHRYIEAKRLNGSVLVRVKHHSVPAPSEAPVPARFFTIPKLEHALGETGHRDLLEPALFSNPDPVVKRALAGALAVPAGEIRRSRTALFLYLLKKHANETNEDDHRP